jgi:predicted dehydrogenase
MDSNKLKTGVLGLTECGLELLEAAWQTGAFDIIAVAGDDPEQTKKIARKYECTGFNDYRQLVIHDQLDVLIVAASTYLCEEHIRTAMKKKINIVKICPPALDFEKTSELVSLAKKEGVLFTVVNTIRFSGGFVKLGEYIQSEGAGGFNLINIVCNVPSGDGDAGNRWLSDPKRAGGGVILRSCYELIDQLTANFGVPEKIYSLNTNCAPDKQQRLSITEDAAVMNMRFSDILMGNLMASRIFGPSEETIRIFGKDKSLAVSADRFALCDNNGKVVEESIYKDKKAEIFTKMFKNLASGLKNPEIKLLWPDGNSILNTMSVIESAYLSARTSMPEEPGRILDMIDSESTNIWSSATKRIV